MKYLIYLIAIIPPAIIEFFTWQDGTVNGEAYKYRTFYLLAICTTTAVSLIPALLIAGWINKVKPLIYLAITLCLISLTLNLFLTREISYLAALGIIFGIYIIRLISSERKTSS